jgi:hypothetical protein
MLRNKKTRLGIIRAPVLHSPFVDDGRRRVQSFMLDNCDADLFSIGQKPCQHGNERVLLKSAGRKSIEPFQGVGPDSHPAVRTRICPQPICLDGLDAFDRRSNKTFEIKQCFNLKFKMTAGQSSNYAVDIQPPGPRSSGCKPL